ncbi:hypothetical protein ARMSODRAFT_1026660 [Armillaria solidipes]|uniref:Uncharacterized protein n=1 Tax=Armillaria solidipes TaxID=1076256 RepID=A0A2H3B6Q4_9AGAR|nr:hypothetical protein ARMSODRAFT_1026660 [Armillaria solidipes]
MSSLPVPPIKTLIPVPDNDDDNKVIKYKYFIQFNPMAYYRPYCEALKLMMPYWCNKSEYSHEEVSNLLKQVYNHLATPSIIQLENENLIDSCVGMSIRHWLTLIHDNLSHQFCLADWHDTIAHSMPEVCPSHVLHRLLPNAPLSGEEDFDIDKLLTILESYLLQHAIFSGTRLHPRITANNTDFPSHVFDRFPTLLANVEEEEEVIVFSDPPAKKVSPATPAHPVASSSTAAPLIPPRSTRPPWTPMSLISLIVHSLGQP